MSSYPILELTGPWADLEIATAHLQDHGCLGTEEHDGGLWAYFSDATNVDAVADDIVRRVPAIRCRVAAPLANRDWLAEWKEGLEAFEIGTRYLVLPTWRPDVRSQRTVLRIDPEQAFGTGTHETTRLCVELIEDYVHDGMSVIDVGAGTGILSMVAAHEGATSVLAVEIDEAAVECARANVERNGLSDNVRVERGSWEERAPVRADVVVANINTNVLRAAAGHMYGTLLLSGILTDDLDDLRHDVPGEVLETRTANEWAALVVRHE